MNIFYYLRGKWLENFFKGIMAIMGALAEIHFNVLFFHGCEVHKKCSTKSIKVKSCCQRKCIILGKNPQKECCKKDF